MLGVEHLVGDVLAPQPRREELRRLDGRGADEDRLAPLPALADLVDDGLELLILLDIDEIGPIVADHREVGRDHGHLEPVDLLELGRLGVRGSGHPRELVVEPEVVLEGDRREGLVLLPDRDPLLRLHRLVQAVGPAPPGHGPAGELVDDDHLAAPHQVVHVAVVEGVGAKGRVEVMEEHHVGGVVERFVAAEQAFLAEQLLHPAVTGLGEVGLPRLLVHGVVAGNVVLFVHRLAFLAFQLRDQAVDAEIQLRALLRRPRDDERRAGLVDEDRIDLVDDGVDEARLRLLDQGEGHVVAQVVESELVVGPVDDVRPVRLALLDRGLSRHHDPHRHAEEPVDLAHPVGVAPREVVVDGDDVDAVPAEGVEAGGERRHEGLPLPGPHLRDAPLVEHQAADELHVEVAHLERAPSRLAHDRECLRDQGVDRLPGRPPAAQGLRDCRELRVLPALKAGLELVDGGHGPAIAAQHALVARPDHSAQDVRHHVLSSS